MKKLLVTRSDDSTQDLAELSHPVFKIFSHKWGTDFLSLDYEDGETHYAYRTMRLGKLLEDYDRIVMIDTDVMIMPGCPNIFVEVPENEIGCVREDLGSRRIHRNKVMVQVQSQFGDVGWTEDYVATGVFVVSKPHTEIFDSVDGEYWQGFGKDCAHIGWNICAKNYTIYPMSYKWNHMSMFSEPWNGSPNKFDSYMVHYSGVETRSMSEMQSDFKKVWG